MRAAETIAWLGVGWFGGQAIIWGGGPGDWAMLLVCLFCAWFLHFTGANKDIIK